MNLTQKELAAQVAKKMWPYLYFVPHGGQESAINAIGNGAITVLITSGNGWGKTALGANIVSNIVCTAPNPYFEKFPMFQPDKFDGKKRIAGWPYPKLGRIVSSPDNISDEGAITMAMEEWLPERGWSRSKGGHNYYNSYTIATGHKIKVLSTEQDPKEFESDTLGWIWFDEPPTYDQYKACLFRLRKGGIIFITATPLYAAGWMKDQIADTADGKTDVWITGDIEDNCQTHGNRGVLKHEHIQRMIDKIDEEEREARAHGKFMYLSGLIYKDFNRDIHVIAANDIEKIWPESVFGKFTDWPSIIINDPHDRKPDAIMWVKITPNDDIIIYDEYPDKMFHLIKDRTDNILDVCRIIHAKEIGDTVKEIRDHLKGRQIIVKRTIDARKGAAPKDDNLTTIDLFSLRSAEISYPIEFVKATQEKRGTDHKAVTEYLKYDKKIPISLTNRPKLYVLHDCRNVIYDFEHYSWDEYRGKTKDYKDVKEKPQEKSKDYMDCLWYLCVDRPKFEDFKDELDRQMNLGDRWEARPRKQGIPVRQNLGDDDWMV